MPRKPRKYAIDDIRSRFQTVAIDNKYQAYIEPNASLYDAARNVGVSNRFIDEDLGLYISDAVLPGSSFADIETVGDRQGITERMPFNRIYDDVTFTFMVDRNYDVMRFFESWLQLVNPLHGNSDGRGDNQIMTLNYPKTYKCNISIVKYNKDFFVRNTSASRVVLHYNFIKAWPLSIASTPVNYDSGSVMKLNVTFRYDRYVMTDVTRGKPRSGWRGFSDSFDPWMGNLSNTRVESKDKSETNKSIDGSIGDFDSNSSEEIWTL